MSLIEDLVLESAVPPPSWLPDRTARLANARAVIARFLGRGKRGGPRFRSTWLHHGGYPGLGRSEVVSGDEVEVTVARELTTINPPVLQGWQLALFVPAAFLEAVGLAGFQHERDPRIAALDVLAPFAVWLLIVAAAGLVQRMIQLTADGVRIRRWLQVWLGRPGVLLGRATEITAHLDTRYRLRLAGPSVDRVVNMIWWPPSACLDIVDELPVWGVDADFVEHEEHHRGRGRQAKARRDRRWAGGARPS